MINISETAADRLKEMLAQQETPGMFLRLGVTPGVVPDFRTPWALMIKNPMRISIWIFRI